MLPRLLALLPACLLVSFLTHAQAYEPGLLVRSNGDTLRGEIENGFWVDPPTFIRYRPSAGTPSQIFEPEQLRAVNLTGGRYFRYERLAIDHAAQTQLDKLPRGNATDVTMESVLAEVLIEGACSLLRVAQPGTVHYFFHRPGQPDLALCARKYLRTNANGALAVTDGNNYQSQLGLYFIECEAANKLALTVPFTSLGLASVAQAYNQACAPVPQAGRSWLVFANPRRKVAFQGGVLAGVRYNRIESPSYALDATCTDCVARPFGGLYADLFMPSRITSIYGEISLSSFRNRVEAYDYKALLSTARLGVRYYIPLPHERQLLFGLGYEWNTVWQPTITDSKVTSPLYSYYQPEIEFATPTLLPNVGCGWRSRRLTFMADAQLYRTRDEGDFMSGLFFGKAVSLRFSTAYRLGRNPDTQAR